MKKTITLLVFLLSFVMYGQIPQGISYQGIAFNGTGIPVVDGTVTLKISILQNSISGAAEYVETHSATTNSRGLFNLSIGQGTPTSGMFSSVTWRNGNKFLKVELDPAGGTNYTSVGTSELMTVPYAMVAGELTNTSGQSLNDIIIENQSTNFAFIDNFDSKVYVFNSENGTWLSQAYNNASNVTLISSKGNFAFIDTFDSKVYVFNDETGNWSNQSYNSAGNTSLVDANGNFAFIDNFDSKVYIFNSSTDTWTSQSYNNGSNVTLISSKGNFGFLDNFDSKVYVFSSNTGTWISQGYNSGSNPTLMSGNGNFAFIDNFDSKAYIFSFSTSMWSSQGYNGGSNPTLESSDTN